ncbi:MAG: phospho-sugar mutase [Clostridiales Family XIII bacterium]|jgi:phosphoglucomutase|nr:phospho-sugar mutase [Clostridiales Family XIII bacterium]
MRKTPLEQLESWLAQPKLDAELGAELEALKGALDRNPEDGAALLDINERFYKDLEFGTGGMRGILGAGPNRMNVYTVRRIAQGLAAHVNKTWKAPNPSVAISYDNRINSERFAFESASVLLANNISAHVYRELAPTPALSFAVRHYGCAAGVMVTASHNAKEYNGYKVYDSHGEQCLPEEADAIAALIDGLDLFDGVRAVPGDFSGTLAEKLAQLGEAAKAAGITAEIRVISEDVEQAYLDAVLALSTGKRDFSNLSIVYTPLNGAGNKPVRRVLEAVGLKNVHIVKEQEEPDGNFPTCPYPNPEKREALELGLRLCRKLEGEGRAPDLLIGTDPDCDRLGVAVYHGGEYVQMTGNEVGVLLLDLVFRHRTRAGTLPDRPMAVMTIVSTPLAAVLAESYGAEVVKVLTGFKYIGEQITLLEGKGEEGRYVFGFEESCGYMSGTHCRDKDAVNACLLMVELAADCKEQGKTVIDRLEEIYGEYGHYENSLAEFTMDGAAGMERIARIMKALRERPAAGLFPKAVAETADYLALERVELSSGRRTAIDLPKSDVLEYVFEGGGSVIARPSGTEPKLKVYFAARGESREAAAAETKVLREAVARLVEEI